jgi:hypothetical protein
VSRFGIFPLAASLDHVGPMPRSAADSGAILGVIAGLDRNDPTTLAAPVPDYLAQLDPGASGVRIGVDTRYNETGCDPEIRANSRASPRHSTRPAIRQSRCPADSRRTVFRSRFKLWAAISRKPYSYEPAMPISRPLTGITGIPPCNSGDDASNGKGAADETPEHFKF